MNAYKVREYEELFSDFYKKLNPVANQIDAFMVDPLNKPHNLSIELMQEIELLHMRLSESLYRLRYGELQEKLATKEINITEFNKLTAGLKEDNLYKNI
jgi:hypothetical protein